MEKLLSPILHDIEQPPPASAAEPVRLSDVELDAVAGGAFNSNVGNTGVGNVSTGLVAVSALGLGIGNVSLL